MFSYKAGIGVTEVYCLLADREQWKFYEVSFERNAGKENVDTQGEGGRIGRGLVNPEMDTLTDEPLFTVKKASTDVRISSEGG